MTNLTNMSVQIEGQGTVEIDFNNLSPETIQAILQRGVTALGNSARAGKGKEEADEAQYRRLKDRKNDILPKSGGSGPRLSQNEKAIREIIEQLAQKHGKQKTQEAQAIARSDDRMADLAKAVLWAKGEKQTKDRVAQAVEKLGPQIDQKAAELVAQWNKPTDLDI